MERDNAQLGLNTPQTVGLRKGIVWRYVAADESVRFAGRPSLWFILLTALGFLTGLAITTAIAAWLVGLLDRPDIAANVVIAGFGLAALRLAWNILEWLSRLYVVTNRRVIAIAGVLRQSVSEVPLNNVRTVVMTRSLVERLLWLGTLGFASAGTDGYEVVWRLMSAPDRLLADVRCMIERPGQGLATAATAVMQGAQWRSEAPMVIGLVGGVGSGKSTVARALAEHNFIVIDSDKDARAVLDRPEVRDELARWWGSKVLLPDASVDRRAVADIVFRDPAQRSRLEALVHPLVKADRGRLIERAKAEGRAGVVIDAPLLYEAGSDKECDLVVFVDAPEAMRRERVAARSGWSPAELERREKAQLPLQEKRRRADEVILNDGDEPTLKARVEAMLSRLRSRPGSNAHS